MTTSAAMYYEDVDVFPLCYRHSRADTHGTLLL